MRIFGAGLVDILVPLIMVALITVFSRFANKEEKQQQNRSPQRQPRHRGRTGQAERNAAGPVHRRAPEVRPEAFFPDIPQPAKPPFHYEQQSWFPDEVKGFESFANEGNSDVFQEMRTSEAYRTEYEDVWGGDYQNQTHDRSLLAKAIVMSEIIGRPVALRDESELFGPKF